MTDWSTVADTDASVELFFGYADEDAYAGCVQQLIDDGVASGIANQDPTLWGPEAHDESAKRLAWVDLAGSSRTLVPQIDDLRSRLHGQGVDHVVLCGMGGSSLAPEVICASAGVELTVLDSSDPDYVRRAIEDRLASTVVVVSSKSGSTVRPTASVARTRRPSATPASIPPSGSSWSPTPDHRWTRRHARPATQC